MLFGFVFLVVRVIEDMGKFIFFKVFIDNSLSFKEFLILKFFLFVTLRYWGEKFF